MAYPWDLTNSMYVWVGEHPDWEHAGTHTTDLPVHRSIHDMPRADPHSPTDFVSADPVRVCVQRTLKAQDVRTFMYMLHGLHIFMTH